EHPDGAGVADVVAVGGLVAGHADGVGDDVDHVSREPLPGLDDLPGLGRGLDHLVTLAATLLSASARAAPTSPLNIGLARVGRDRNSGWAWVPMKNGWTSAGSSVYSTRRSSGDTPENTRPTFSSRSR